MVTTTPTRSLRDVLRQRWDDAPKGSWHSASGDPLEDACMQLSESLIGPYIIEFEARSGDSVELADGWIQDTEDAIRDIVRAAWEERVVPAVIDTIVERMPSFPQWVAAHPKAEQLRADLALAATT
jgi:hypothetical protein